MEGLPFLPGNSFRDPTVSITIIFFYLFTNFYHRKNFSENAENRYAADSLDTNQRLSRKCTDHMCCFQCYVFKCIIINFLESGVTCNGIIEPDLKKLHIFFLPLIN